ncbi:mechanosensitive ion channel family protein [Carboxylicivirga sp. M1479]|uniref:mechanosensitive ion channel family protein n=1 Tax=Carboxylicivirga sp. M1479 TaxID=2594476 RepID=UPI001178971E|nr:mechanosensitive ion channel domain-containing protein [Carboxylicivirga sp. M1479]TRX65937.1 mechanosensitive ion channel [Carboxylicivirga sp. M1479]
MNRSKFILLLFVATCSHLLMAQEEIIQPTDTIVEHSVDLIEIPSKSASTVSNIKKLNKSLLTNKQVDKVKSTNMLNLALIDSLFMLESKVDLSIFNKRHLLNKETYWKQRLDQVKGIESEMIDRLEKIETINSEAEAIDKVWLGIDKQLSEEERDSVVNVNIQRVMIQKDSLIEKLIHQRGEFLVVQDKAISSATNITSQLERFEQKINDEETNIFAKSDIQFREIFKLHNYKSATQVLKKNLSIESKLLADYMASNRQNIFIFCLILFGGIFIFRQTRKSILTNDIQEEGYYKVQFKKLLSAYKSTAFVLIIWLSVPIFPNQPLLFSDIIQILISIPLAILLYRLVDKWLFLSVVILFSLIFVQVFVNLFPPNHMVYRFFLFIAAVLEIFVLVKLFFLYKKNPFKNRLANNLTSNLLLISIFGAIVALLLGLLGYIVLVEQFVNIILSNTFSIALLFVSMLIVIGIIELLFDKMNKQKYKVLEVYGDSTKKRLIWFVATLTKIIAILTILGSVNLKDIVYDSVVEMISYQFVITETFSFSIGRIIALILIISFSIFVANVIKITLEEDVLSKTKLGKGLPHTIALLAKYCLILIGVTFAISTAGLPMSNFAVLIGAFGVGIGFGLQNIFNNLVSGLILLFERPIKIDDTIEVGQLLGKVKSIGIRSSIVRTFDGAEVIVPNGQLISNEVINWTHSDQIRRHEIFVGVAYGSDAKQVKALLEEQIKLHEDILQYPEPMVLFINMGESSLDFRLLFWISKMSEGLRIKSEMTKMIYEALNKEGIEIPFPQRDIHIIKD